MGQISSYTLTPLTCEVLIVGAGPAGTVAARLLALAGIKVVLVDRVNIEQQKIGESLPGAARPMLERLGLVSWVEKSSSIINKGNLSCWGGTQLVATDFIRDPYGCGWHLDRQQFDQNLRDAAEDAGALMIKGRISSVVENSDGIQAKVGDQSITAQWVIDASGNSRFVASMFGVSKHRDAPLFALYAWCKNNTVDTRSVVEAVPTGWWYTAGLPDEQRVLAFFSLPEQIKILRDKDNFISALKETIHIANWCPAAGISSSPLQVTEATGSYLDKVFGARWLAVGNVALSFEPLSSQGIYNAIYTGLRGAEAVKAALIDNDRSLLIQYGERIKSIRAAYSIAISGYYQQEQRWPEQPFWIEHQNERL
ncbi:tryptophan 7-halogenase [Arsenophonus sp.]|uniref:tryptophan 7-halogenase n=1 Tax=Arsenophonus sp. TaxID=1872640 RepID=UPI002865A9AC|nr:tryptophan 7-halogenase [Arsenophonus sp.]MDR5615773.1 tryptophan 7-halogenase [Arsenophonus sp.]